MLIQLIASQRFENTKVVNNTVELNDKTTLESNRTWPNGLHTFQAPRRWTKMVRNVGRSYIDGMSMQYVPDSIIIITFTNYRTTNDSIRSLEV